MTSFAYSVAEVPMLGVLLAMWQMKVSFSQEQN